LGSTYINNIAFDKDLSTLYVNLPHYAAFRSEPQITLDDQHAEFESFNLLEVSNNEKFSAYIRNYASRLLNNMDNTYD
jgi:hypothetical protein